MTIQNTWGDEDGEVMGQSGGKIGFYGTTPAAQAAATTAPATTASTSSSPYGFSSTQANAITTWIAAVDTALKNVGLIAT